MANSRLGGASTDSTFIAVVAGLVAALVAGGVWAGIVLLTQYEIGWAAWGVGAAVGLAMGMATGRRSTGLAIVAALLAVIGLGAGKTFVVVGSVGSVAAELLENPSYLEGALAWQMYQNGELDQTTVEAIQATELAGDTLSDLLWSEMLSQAAVRLAGIDDGGRRSLADEYARAFIGDIGVVGGVRSQLSGFDLLWVILAVGTAFGLMNRRSAGFGR